MRDHLPFPAQGDIDPDNLESQIDSSESYYLPTREFLSSQLSFVPREGQTALRVFLGYANAKISLVVDGESGVKVESKSQDSAHAQLLIATDLEVGRKYNIIFEFTERASILDGEGALGCETLTLGFRTWDSSKVCNQGLEKSDASYPITTTPGADATT